MHSHAGAGDRPPPLWLLRAVDLDATLDIRVRTCVCLCACVCMYICICVCLCAREYILYIMCVYIICYVYIITLSTFVVGILSRGERGRENKRCPISPCPQRMNSSR
jgi:hypothetical protein